MASAIDRPESRESISTSTSTATLTSTSNAPSTIGNDRAKRPSQDIQSSLRQKRLRFELDMLSRATMSPRRSTVSSATSAISSVPTANNTSESRSTTGDSTSSSSSMTQFSRRQASIHLGQPSRASTSESTVSTSQSAANSYNGATSASRAASTTRTRTRPRTSTTYLTTGASSEQAVICAVTESRGVSPTVGLAYVNLNTFQASLCEIVDSQLYVRTKQKLYTWSPNVILYPSTLSESRMMMFLSADLPAVVESRITDKRYFTENDGRDHLQQLALTAELEPLKVAVDGKFYALCAFSGVLEYLRHDGEYNFARSSLRISFEASDGSMMIDLATIASLELVQNLHDAKSKDSLFGLVNETLTPMGSRLLRSWVLQPSTQGDILTKRYDAIEELTSHENIFVEVRNALKGFVDVDKVLTNIVILPSEKNLTQWQDQCINYVLVLKDFVGRVIPIFKALARAESEVLAQIRSACAPKSYISIVAMINETINADTCFSRKPLEMRNQRLYAVKSGASDLLDVARTAHKETVDDAMKHCRELAEMHELSLEMSFDNKRGYFMRFPAHELEGRALNSGVFINVFRNRMYVECQTMDLLKMNGKLASSNNEVMLMSAGAVTDLVQRIRSEIGPLFKISDSVAMLDALAALAYVATQYDYIRPRVASTTAIKAAKHPIKIKNARSKFIPNDVYAPSSARLQVLTGCNMSGKSTYIRTIALLQVMAQIGSFVPAEHAEFSVRNQLFARVSTDDNISANVSTFAAEMRETAFILGHVDSKSIVIVDELGRGTSTTDGLAIAIAIAEELLKSGASVWFVTHFHDLARYLEKRPGVSNLHLSVNLQRQDHMVMLYTIASGPVREKSYGISLARIACLPGQVIERAAEVATVLKRQQSQFSEDSHAGIQARKQKLLLGLRDQLLWAKESSMDATELHDWMNALQCEFVNRMDELSQAEEKLGTDTAIFDALTGESECESALSATGLEDGAVSDVSANSGASGNTFQAESPTLSSYRRPGKSGSVIPLPHRPKSSSMIPETIIGQGPDHAFSRNPTRADFGETNRQSINDMGRIPNQQMRPSSAMLAATSRSLGSEPVSSRSPTFKDSSHVGGSQRLKNLPPVPLFSSTDTCVKKNMTGTSSLDLDMTSGHMADDEESMFEDILESESDNPWTGRPQSSPIKGSRPTIQAYQEDVSVLDSGEDLVSASASLSSSDDVPGAGMPEYGSTLGKNFPQRQDVPSVKTRSGLFVQTSDPTRAERFDPDEVPHEYDGEGQFYEEDVSFKGDSGGKMGMIDA